VTVNYKEFVEERLTTKLAVGGRRRQPIRGQLEKLELGRKLKNV